MITLDELRRQVAGLQMDALQRWIANDWVRPLGESGRYRFEDIDVARVRLIVTLHQEMHVDEEAVPIVLSLLDQLHDARRTMRRLKAAIDEAVPAEARQKLQDRLRQVIIETE